MYVKAEFNESSIGESQKFLVTSDSVPELNFSFSLNVNTSDPISLDDLANKPIISKINWDFIYSYIYYID